MLTNKKLNLQNKRGIKYILWFQMAQHWNWSEAVCLDTGTVQQGEGNVENPMANTSNCVPSRISLGCASGIYLSTLWNGPASSSVFGWQGKWEGAASADRIVGTTQLRKLSRGNSAFPLHFRVTGDCQHHSRLCPPEPYPHAQRGLTVRGYCHWEWTECGNQPGHYSRSGNHYQTELYPNSKPWEAFV